jgi:hypothetical protein
VSTPSAGPVLVDFSHLAPVVGGGGLEAAAAEMHRPLEPADEVLLGTILRNLQDATSDPGVLCAPNDQATALMQSALAERAAQRGQVEPRPDGGLEAKFDDRDFGWIRELIPHIRAKLGISRRAPRPPIGDVRDTVPDECTFAVLGDWGTGLYGARPIADAVGQAGDHDALLHLGDVYYGGTEREVQENFLDLWRPMAEANRRSVSRACNSNHEMYSGGGPYFEMTLPAFGQQSPVFILENRFWTFVGLDSAYDDHDLDDVQVRLLEKIVGGLDGRKLVLLSHHQPFSLLAGGGPKLVRRLQNLLEARQIFAWYWGHEHLLALYDEHPRWGLHGRCVGHSGFPYPRPLLGDAPRTELPQGHTFAAMPGTQDAPGARILDGANDFLGDKRERYGPNGYVRLQLDGPRLVESVMSPTGLVLHRTELS